MTFSIFSAVALIAAMVAAGIAFSALEWHGLRELEKKVPERVRSGMRAIDIGWSLFSFFLILSVIFLCFDVAVSGVAGTSMAGERGRYVINAAFFCGAFAVLLHLDKYPRFLAGRVWSAMVALFCIFVLVVLWRIFAGYPAGKPGYLELGAFAVFILHHLAFVQPGKVFHMPGEEKDGECASRPRREQWLAFGGNAKVRAVCLLSMYALAYAFIVCMSAYITAFVAYEGKADDGGMLRIMLFFLAFSWAVPWLFFLLCGRGANAVKTAFRAVVLYCVLGIVLLLSSNIMLVMAAPLDLTLVDNLLGLGVWQLVWLFFVSIVLGLRGCDAVRPVAPDAVKDMNLLRFYESPAYDVILIVAVVFSGLFIP